MKKLIILTSLLIYIFALSAIGDVLTIIQRPILSVPQITVPGETFTIECVAPENTQNWQASLVFEDITLPLHINSEVDIELKNWGLLAFHWPLTIRNYGYMSMYIPMASFLVRFK